VRACPFGSASPEATLARHFSLAAVFLVIWVPLVATGCGRDGASASPQRVLLVTLDTTRADRLGCYGYDGASTPVLDSLAREGVLFEDVVAPSPLTLPSHTTLLTGTLPALHGVRNNATYRLGLGLATLAERFREAGYRSAAVVGSLMLDSRFGLDRGFELYDDEMPPQRDAATLVAERPASEVTRRALDWIARQGDQRWFLWVHYFDPHFEYASPEPFLSRFAQRPYDGEIAYVDSELGRIVRELEAAGRLDGTLVAVTSDHGESLGEHGERSHGIFIYGATMRVPLILRWDGVLPRRRSVEGLVQLSDVAPTLLDLAGLPPLPRAQGGSLRRAIEAGTAGGRPAILESWLPRLNYGWSELAGFQDGRWKYIRAPTPELYDLVDDPAETDNRASREPGLVEEYGSRLERGLAAASGETQGSGAAHAAPLDPSMERVLRSLGYLGGDASRGAGGSPPGVSGAAAASPGNRASGSASLPDPKDKIAEFVEISEVLHLLAAGRTQEGIARLEAAEHSNPRSVFIRRQLGNAYRAQGRWELAEAELRAAVRLNPDHPDTRVDLASLLIERAPRGDPGLEAEGLLREALRLSPELAGARHFLGALHHKRGEKERAAAEYRTALELDPFNPITLGNLAVILEERGDLDGALALYHRGMEVDPANVRMISSAAWIETRRGHPDQAVELLGRAAGLEPSSPGPLLALAQVFESSKQYDSALAALRQAVSRETSPAGASLELGRYLLRRGDPCGALEALGGFADRPGAPLGGQVRTAREEARRSCKR